YRDWCSLRAISSCSCLILSLPITAFRIRSLAFIIFITACKIFNPDRRARLPTIQPGTPSKAIDMRLIQFINSATRREVGIIRDDGQHVDAVKDTPSVHALAMAAIAAGRSLEAEVAARGTTPVSESYATLLWEQRVLVPLDHEAPAHCLVTGPGLTP